MAIPGPDRPLCEPLVFTPYFRPQVWGGRRLQQHFGRSLPEGVAIGESWELSAQPLHVSRVGEGPWAGVSLKELWDDRRAELLGNSMVPAGPFPWLIKWLDCHELLSVQVHPDDGAAQRMLGEPCGKTETWVVVSAEPTAQIFAGLRSGVTRKELERRSKDGTIAECLHQFTPQAGDCIHIPAGTVHAMGGGIVLAEVQQTSDATFRLFDWNRVDAQGKSRTLHREQALDVVDFQRGPVNPVTPQRVNDGSECLVRCPYYHLDRFRVLGPWAAQIDRLTVVMILNGNVDLVCSESRLRRRFRPGDTVLIPAAVQNVLWAPIFNSPAPELLIIRSPQ